MSYATGWPSIGVLLLRKGLAAMGFVMLIRDIQSAHWLWLRTPDEVRGGFVFSGWRLVDDVVVDDDYDDG